jgi:L-ascorbate metabolism protein UlaG (beta-lactamase superfamily)
MNIEWKNIITDPVFYKASPVFFWWKTFNYTNPPKVENLPELDFVLISHDHYDHLDYKTITEIDSKVKKYLVPLWVSVHLEKWWVDSNKIVEHDWYSLTSSSEIDFTFTPTRHFSWRGLTNRNSTLWWSWVIKWKESSMFFSWDTWYFDEFKKIWEKYWPFDIAFIENWAYNESWSTIHMYPEQSVQVWIDLKAENIMPIHWGKFDLSLHAWYEPIERFTLEAEKKWLSYIHPKVWEVFDNENLPKINWWNDLITE